ncbi:MAG: AAA family ATPase [Actinobacteria bacterium]|nr:AAA family ATPase [Actinomycetota bacterium]
MMAGKKISEDMHLLRVSMDEFGKFSRRMIGAFKPGLNVVYGSNEAGKSTTVVFIRNLLYGWLPSRKNANSYKPRTNNRCGSLSFKDATGEWEIFRDKTGATRVTGYNGPSWDGLLEELCEEVTKETYESVFSFNADELLTIKMSENIASKLLTASSGTALAPTEALAVVNSRIAKVVSSQSGEPYALGTLRKDIRELKEEIAALESRAEALTEKSRELPVISRKLDILTGQLDVLNKQAQDLNAAKQKVRDLEMRREALRTRFEENQMGLRKTDVDLASHALSVSEGILLKNEINIKKSQEEASALRARLDRLEDRRVDYDAAQAQIATAKGYGCSSDQTTKQVLVELRARRLDLERMRQLADERLKEAQADRVGFEARGDLQATDSAKPVSSGPLIALGIVAFLAGIAAAYLGFVTSSSIAIISGAVSAVLGIVLFILGLPKGARRDSAAEYARQRRLEEFVEKEGRAKERLALAVQDLELFDDESEAFLEEKGLDAAESNLDAALAMVEEERQLQAKRDDCSAKQRLYEKGEKEVEGHARVIRLALSAFKHQIGPASDYELLACLTSLSESLEVAKEKLVTIERLEEGKEYLLATRDEIIDQLEGEQGKLTEIARENGVDPELDLERELTIRLEQVEANRRLCQSDLGEVQRLYGETCELLNAGAKEMQLQVLNEELAEKVEQQRRSAREYARLLTAQKLLQDAIVAWESEKQPEVYQLANEIFSDMTAGKWTTISVEDDVIYAINDEHEKKTPEFLSTGTCQQLYLSLRIALLLSASEVGRGLPVVADDILINFDAQRRVGAARALARLAQERQVIIFTCHKETQELLKSIEPSTNTFDIGA